jgi:hypothetical protein
MLASLGNRHAPISAAESRSAFFRSRQPAAGRAPGASRRTEDCRLVISYTELDKQVEAGNLTEAFARAVAPAKPELPASEQASPALSSPL